MNMEFRAVGQEELLLLDEDPPFVEELVLLPELSDFFEESLDDDELPALSAFSAFL
jgi:hypothetical protein